MDYSTDRLTQAKSDPSFARHLLPWLALAVLLGVMGSMWMSFGRELREMRSTPVQMGSLTDTGTAAADAASIAVVRVEGVKIRSAPDSSAVILGLPKPGTTLEILSGQDPWYRVKDTSGRIGWITNSAQAIEIRAR